MMELVSLRAQHLMFSMYSNQQNNKMSVTARCHGRPASQDKSQDLTRAPWSAPAFSYPEFHLLSHHVVSRAHVSSELT